MPDWPDPPDLRDNPPPRFRRVQRDDLGRPFGPGAPDEPAPPAWEQGGPGGALPPYGPRAPSARGEQVRGFLDRFGGDRGMLQAAAMVAVLGVVMLVLVLPPISILGRDEDVPPAAQAGVTIRARDEMPAVPAGLEALSSLYDIEGGGSPSGPATLTVRLSKRTEDARQLGFYTYVDGQWKRVGAAVPVEDGRQARGEVDAVPSNLAVLRRTAPARAFAVIVPAGEQPDPAAAGAAIVSVAAAVPVTGTDSLGSLELSDRLSGALGGTEGGARYLAVSANGGAEAAAVNRILADPAATRRHADAIVAAVDATRAAGLHLDYSAVEPGRRASYTAFVEQVNQRLRQSRRGLVVTVPAPQGDDTGGYDWAALGAVADQLWLRGPADASTYYERLEQALQARRAQGFDLGKVALVLDRRSQERSPDGVRALSVRDALAIASTLRTKPDQGAINAGDAVPIIGANIDQDAGNSGLRWDDRARAIAYTYGDRAAPRTVWIENRFSMAFRIDLAQRLGLGGIVVDAAQQDDALPDVWPAVTSYASEGGVRLELPYGPYLLPRWLASGGTIEGAGARGTATWRTPRQPGVYEVTLVVSDGVLFVGQQLSLRVAGEGDQAPAIPATSVPTTAAATPTARTVLPTSTPVATATTVTATATRTPTVVATEAPTVTRTATAAATATARATSTAGGSE